MTVIWHALVWSDNDVSKSPIELQADASLIWFAIDGFTPSRRSPKDRRADAIVSE